MFLSNLWIFFQVGEKIDMSSFLRCFQQLTPTQLTSALTFCDKSKHKQKNFWRKFTWSFQKENLKSRRWLHSIRWLMPFTKIWLTLHYQTVICRVRTAPDWLGKILKKKRPKNSIIESDQFLRICVWSATK